MNVFDYLFESSKYLDKNFVLGARETISFSKLHDNSLKVAGYIQNKVGINKNVVLISPNSVFFITAYLGILKSGNTCIPLNFAIEPDTLDYILKITQSDLVFAAKQVKSGISFDPKITTISEEELELLLSELPLAPVTDASNNPLAEIIFTSGSTGEPKGVMISHKNIIANTEAIIEYLALSEKDIIGVVLPFFYCYGLSLLHTHLKVGGCLVLNNNFIFLGSVINDLKKYKCTGFAGVPSHFQILLKKSTTFKNTKFPDLRYVTQAGGKLHAIFINDFIASFPAIDFYVMYGQTEATARLSYLPPHMLSEKMESIGLPIPGVTLEVINEKGDPVGFDEQGELVARGENIMMGYYQDELGTQQALKNGWLYTGDIAKKDADGYFYIVARKKEIIKVGGKRVSPKEIEEVILSIPEIVDCTIKGIDDDLLGEALQATVVINDLSRQEEIKELILKRCSKRLALYKIPQLFIFENAIRMNATGKKK